MTLNHYVSWHYYTIIITMDSLLANFQLNMALGPAMESFVRPAYNRDENLHFKVAGFSMGSMAPKADAYYEVSEKPWQYLVAV